MPANLEHENEKFLYLAALKKQIAKDNIQERQQLFKDIASRYGVLPIIACLERRQFLEIKAFCLLLLGFLRSGSFLSLSRKSNVYFLFWSPAEMKTLKNWRDILDIHSSELVNWSMSFRKLVSFPFFLIRNFLLLRTFLRLSMRLSKRYSFFVAARAIEAILTTHWFRQVLNHRKVHFVVSSDSNPHSTALLALAKIDMIGISFFAHSPYVLNPQKMKATIAVFWGQASYEQFMNVGSSFGAYYFCSPPLLHPIKVHAPHSILICLSKTLDPDSLELLIAKIEKKYQRTGLEIIIRSHPNINSISLSKFKRFISINRSIEEDLKNCLFAVAGNSTVHLDIMARHIPSIHSSLVDGQFDKTLSFLQDGLIHDLEQVLINESQSPSSFYGEQQFAFIRQRYFNALCDLNECAVRIRIGILNSLS